MKKRTITFKQLKRLVAEHTDAPIDDVLSFREVEPGDLGKDYNGEEWLILKKGTAEELIKRGDDPTGTLEDGVMSEYIDPSEPCVLAKHLTDNDVAAWVYGEDGIQVYVVLDEVTEDDDTPRMKYIDDWLMPDQLTDDEFTDFTYFVDKYTGTEAYSNYKQKMPEDLFNEVYDAWLTEWERNHPNKP